MRLWLAVLALAVPLFASPAWAIFTKTLSTSDASGGTKNSAAWEVDLTGEHVNIECGAVVTGTATFSVQYTYNNVNDGSVTTTWWNHPLATDQTANAEAAFDRPVRAIRLQQTAGNGSVSMTCVQGSPRG